MGRVVKRAFRYRSYPTDVQAAELARTFGCVRKVYNLDGQLTLAKMDHPLTIVGSRPLPGGASPSTVTVCDAGWRQFRDLVEYKADWYRRTVVAVDRWFPSSKLCSSCGALAETMLPHVRTWICRCGAVHDRDVNAAHNILAEGLSVTACGGGVRPQRESSRAGQSSVKQEPQRVTAGIPFV